MLMYGQGVSDRFLYGFYTDIVAMRHENEDTLPELSTDRYQVIHDDQDRMRAEQNQLAIEYFRKLIFKKGL